ncbi:MAG: hypothetical protein CVU01_02495 [Bacteroidetes bacterium HGW-Bacteroidetes-18]|nr:MAG: hypothetical protein CVU01_02495 [Bacteroidetes bacterium HGW-Bacteroidetes-18]
MRTLCTLSTFLFIITSNLVSAQDNMLIEQLAGKTIIRENFDKGSQLIGKQIFRISNIEKSSTSYSVEITTELYRKDGTLDEKYKTYYTCKPDKSSMIVMVFPLFAPKSKKIEIETQSSDYKDLYDLNDLKDIHLRLSFDSGILNFFGSKNNIKIYNRKLATGSNTKTLNSQIEIKAYLLGINVKTISYKVKEIFDENKNLTRQEFKATDGSYFTTSYK